MTKWIRRYTLVDYVNISELGMPGNLSVPKGQMGNNPVQLSEVGATNSYNLVFLFIFF